MKITFYDCDGQRITTVCTDADDYWEACLEGHRYLDDATIANAEEFDVIEGDMS